MPDWNVQTPVSGLRSTTSASTAVTPGTNLPWAWYYRPAAELIDPAVPANNVASQWLLDYQSTDGIFSEWTADKATYIGCPKGHYYYWLLMNMSNSSLAWSATPTTGIVWGSLDPSVQASGGGGVIYERHLVYGEVPGNKRLPTDKFVDGVVETVVGGSDRLRFTCGSITDILGTITSGNLQFYMTLFVCKLGEPRP